DPVRSRYTRPTARRLDRSLDRNGLRTRVVEFEQRRIAGRCRNVAFDLFITTDQNLQNQQNLSKRRLAIIVLPTTRWPQIQRHTADVVTAVASVKPGEYLELSW